MRNHQKINNHILSRIRKASKRGTGAELLGVFMALLSFAILVTLLQVFIIHSSAIQASILADVLSDGIVAFAKVPMPNDDPGTYPDGDLGNRAYGINAAKAGLMANVLIDKNYDMLIFSDIMLEGMNRNNFTFYSDEITTDHSRSGYDDAIFTFNYAAKCKYVVNEALFAGEHWTTSGSTKILALAETANPVLYLGAILTYPEADLSDTEKYVMQYFYENRTDEQENSRVLSEDSDQYNAIMLGFSRLGWKYSTEFRWERGARDSASFVIDAYQNAANDADSIPDPYKSGGTTTKELYDALDGAHRLKEVPYGESLNIQEKLQIGMILFWTASDHRDEPVYCGIYLGIYNGFPYVMMASPEEGDVCIRQVTGANFNLRDAEHRIIAYGWASRSYSGTYLEIAKEIAEDDSHGYCNGSCVEGPVHDDGTPCTTDDGSPYHLSTRCGNPDFDCGSYVNYCISESGTDPMDSPFLGPDGLLQHCMDSPLWEVISLTDNPDVLIQEGDIIFYPPEAGDEYTVSRHVALANSDETSINAFFECYQAMGNWDNRRGDGAAHGGRQEIGLTYVTRQDAFYIARLY